MDILIIGGSRFVGPILVKELIDKGNNITIFNRGQVRSDYGDVDFIRGDRDAGFRIHKGFDVVIDMCAYMGRHTKAAIEQLDFDFFVHMSTAAAYRKSEV